MESMPNRSTRRNIAKQLGLLKKRANLPFKAYTEEISRSQNAGKEIHRQKTEQNMRDLDEYLTIKEQKQLSHEEAHKKTTDTIGNLDSKRDEERAA